MTLADFEKNKELDEKNKLWTVRSGQSIFIRAENHKHSVYGCPAHLVMFKDQYIWEVSPSGKKLHIDNLEIV